MQQLKQLSKTSRCEPVKYKYKKSSYVKIFEVFQSLRKDKVLCDFKLETDDGKIILGHKVVLASASPYFYAMFTNFEESNKYFVIIKQLDSTILQLLVDFIYSGEIMITENNVQVLLLAANLLELLEIIEACCDFLQTQLHPTNCIGINALADLNSCMKLLINSELYIQQHFLEVVEGDEFLSLPSEQMVELISNDELIVPSEEKVFECVIRWVKHELSSRKCILPQLIEHVRLPLISKDFILKKVAEEPLLNNCPRCKEYIIEGLQFNLLKADELITIPQNIRFKPRLRDKVIFVVGGVGPKAFCSSEWYDPKINRWQIGPEMITPNSRTADLVVLKDNFVFASSNSLILPVKSVNVLDLSSKPPCWKPTVNMLIKRQSFGCGIIDNYLYAVGGYDGKNVVNSVEVFDCSTQEWRMVTCMSTRRAAVGVGILNNLLYVVGGYNLSLKWSLKSVECYHPSIDKWIPVTDMSVPRSGVSIGILDGVLYAIGGHDGSKVLSSVEAYRPSTGIWTTIADMHLCRKHAGVVALDGLLYVVGGRDRTSKLNSIELYNPNTNTWTMVTASMNVARYLPGVVAIDRPSYLKTL